MSMRKTWGSVADSTRVTMSRISSEYKDLDIAVVKATNHVESPPKEKHVRTIFAYTSATRPRADVAYCIHAIGKRISKTNNWVVALKCLMVVHRTLREGDPTFREELINYERNRGRMLNLTTFKDESGPAAWDYSAWVRTYALYLEERLECFRVLKYDVESERSSAQSKTRELDTPDLLEHVPALQSLLHRLMACQPEGAAVSNHVCQAALGLVLKESFKLYRAINDGIINLVDKFFEMQKHDASKGLDIYKRAGVQAERLSDFYEMCKSLDLARSFQFPTLEQPPQSFLSTMEEYVKDSKPPPRPEVIAESSEDGSRKKATPPKPVQEEPPPPPVPETSKATDFLGLDSDIPATSNNASQMEYDNSMALAIVPQDANGNATAGPQNGDPFSLDSTSGWELALVTAPSATATPAGNGSYNGSQKLAGGLDKLTLDSLYEDAVRRSPYPSQGAYSTGNPNQPPTMLALPAPPGSFQGTQPMFGGPPQDPFAASGRVAPPPSVQMAHMAQQQQVLFGQQQQFGYGMQPQGYSAVSPVPYGGAGYGVQNPQMVANPFASPYAQPQQQTPPAAQYQSNPFGNPTLL